MGAWGFVNQAFRNMINWKWYHDYPVNILFHHLLHIANVDDIVINGLCVKAGSVLTTIPCLSFATGLTEKQIRTACEKLISSNDISINSFHKKGSIITVTEWDKYVLDNSDNSKLNKSINFDKGGKTADKGQIQSVDDNNVTTPSKTKGADKGQINDENDASVGKRADKRADKLESQHVDLQNNANETICDWADKRADKGQINELPKEAENRETSPETLKENKEQENDIKEKNTKKEKTTAYPFDMFWNLYDKKHDKTKCEKFWNKMSEEDRKACMEYLPAYIEATKDDPQYRRYPYTFLYNRSWEDDLPQQSTPTQPLLQFAEQSPFVALPKTVDDVIAKTQELNIAIPREEAEKFFNHYKALGWKKNGQPICDWTALLRNWQSNIGKFDYGSEGQQRTPTPQENSDPWWKNLREP